MNNHNSIAKLNQIGAGIVKLQQDALSLQQQLMGVVTELQNNQIGQMTPGWPQQPMPGATLQPYPGPFGPFGQSPEPGWQDPFRQVSQPFSSTIDAMRTGLAYANLTQAFRNSNLPDDVFQEIKGRSKSITAWYLVYGKSTGWSIQVDWATETADVDTAIFDVEHIRFPQQALISANNKEVEGGFIVIGHHGENYPDFFKDNPCGWFSFKTFGGFKITGRPYNRNPVLDRNGELFLMVGQVVNIYQNLAMPTKPDLNYLFHYLAHKGSAVSVSFLYPQKRPSLAWAFEMDPHDPEKRVYLRIALRKAASDDLEFETIKEVSYQVKVLIPNTNDGPSLSATFKTVQPILESEAQSLGLEDFGYRPGSGGEFTLNVLQFHGIIEPNEVEGDSKEVDLDTFSQDYESLVKSVAYVQAYRQSFGTRVPPMVMVHQGCAWAPVQMETEADPSLYTEFPSKAQ